MGDEEEWTWPPPEGVVILATITCRGCGNTWTVTEQDSGNIVKGPHGYECAKCGHRGVFEHGVRKFRPGQG